MYDEIKGVTPDAVNGGGSDLEDVDVDVDVEEDIWELTPSHIRRRLRALGLPHRMEVFVREYLKHGNASRACITAGYSPKNAACQGHRLIRRDDVRAAIELHRVLISLTVMSPEEIAREYSRIARADIRDFIEFGMRRSLPPSDTGAGEAGDDGADVERERRYRYHRGEHPDIKTDPTMEPYVTLKSSDEVDGRVVQELALTRAGDVRIRLHDKLRAMDQLSKLLGIYSDDREPTRVEIAFVPPPRPVGGVLPSALEGDVEGLDNGDVDDAVVDSDDDDVDEE